MATIDRGPIWLRHAFLTPTSEDQTQYGSETKRRFATSAAFKFTNTTLGGNWCINNPPQFTRWADIRQPGRGRDESKDSRKWGMGRYYSEAIDDPRQMVTMSFGVPRFSNWSSFFVNFYDRNSALLANTGRVNDLWYNLGNVGGFIVSLPIQPIIMGVMGVSRVLSFLGKSSPSKWMYFKPSMHVYWSTVNTIANEMAINMGLIPKVLPEAQRPLEDPGQRVTLDDIKRFHEIIPDIFRAEGGVDVMSLAGKTQRMSDASQRNLQAMADKAATLADLKASIEKYQQEAVTDPNPGYSARQYMEEYIKNADTVTDGGPSTESFSSWSELTKVSDFIIAAQRDAMQFVSFRVKHNGSLSESWSSTTKASEVAQQINTKVSAGRSVSFNTMNGGIVPGMSDVLDKVQSYAAGALDSVNLGGLAVLTGTAFIDVPEMWESASATLPSASYTVTLDSPYGNKISRFMNLMIPIAMLLAGGLPLSAGRSAYTSPFLCQIYHQGRVQRQLGIIDEITLTRGTGNVGWNAEHDMLGAELTFNVKDLSSIMHMGVKGGYASASWLGTATRAAAATVGEAVGGSTGLNTAVALTDPSVYDESSLFNDYIATITSLSLADAFYAGKRLNVNLTRSVQAFKSWRSPSNLLSWGLDGGTARFISAFANTTDRLE
jgi:hypothetical protein